LNLISYILISIFVFLLVLLLRDYRGCLGMLLWHLVLIVLGQIDQGKNVWDEISLFVLVLVLLITYLIYLIQLLCKLQQIWLLWLLLLALLLNRLEQRGLVWSNCRNRLVLIWLWFLISNLFIILIGLQ